ncbi:c-type cytochrome [Pseudothauera nasutitermitis]|uniref:C-type cytochrome n=1 Tax=Pseudothauera nasutitermitis TaxID=2565930 RepID=A0A4S4B879_9RHOO|nr:c-type cytochrome [Pseudothauera nasutitermitis]THF67213.1 c-type cytochrome [Pseudothauera nasutitermitis]
MTKIQRALSTALFAGAALGATAAQAAEDPQVRAWAATCATCHGTNGASATGIPAIAGLDSERAYTLLKEFKEGTRPATVMHQHAKGYTDEELKSLAAYFSRQRP